MLGNIIRGLLGLSVRTLKLRKFLLGYIWSVIIHHAYKSSPFHKSAVEEKIAEVVKCSGFI